MTDIRFTTKRKGAVDSGRLSWKRNDLRGLRRDVG